jgi:hypothetical protein
VEKEIGGKKLANGESKKESYHGAPSTHAEEDALRNLNLSNISPRNRVVDILVVRFSKSGELGESRPCDHCLKKMAKSCVAVNDVYYSTCNGIVKEKFIDMINSDRSHISYGDRMRMSGCHQTKKK